MENNKTTIGVSEEENYKQESILIAKEVRDRNSILCVYCGDIATTKEHLMPLSYFNSDRDIAKNIFNIRGWKTIPACLSCNELAWCSLNKSFQERKAVILKRFEKRYKKQIKAKSCSKEEINELSGMLKKMVKKSVAKDSFIKNRHANLKNPNPIYN